MFAAHGAGAKILREPKIELAGRKLSTELEEALAKLGQALRAQVQMSLPDIVLQFDLVISVDFSSTPPRGRGVLLRSIEECRVAPNLHPSPARSQ